MCHSKEPGEPSPWLAIDYGVSVTVERVEIFTREDCCGHRIRNVNVRISNELPSSGSQMFSGGSLLGFFAGPAVDGQPIIMSGKNEHLFYWRSRSKFQVKFCLVDMLLSKWTMVREFRSTSRRWWLLGKQVRRQWQKCTVNAMNMI